MIIIIHEYRDYMNARPYLWNSTMLKDVCDIKLKLNSNFLTEHHRQ